MSKNDDVFTAVKSGKRRIVLSFGLHDNEFIKCFPSDTFLGVQYDVSPVEFLFEWDVFLRKYSCEMQFYDVKGQLLVSVPVPKVKHSNYTIIDGVINEWVSKEKDVFMQFVFSDGTGYRKSTVPVKMSFTEANRPRFSRVVKLTDIDKMQEVYDKSIATVELRFDINNGWVYDFYSLDGTLKFSLGWIPKDVLRGTSMVLTPNEKMVARDNIGVPFTFVLPLKTTDGTNVIKNTSEYINELHEASIEVWKDNGAGSFTLVTPLEVSYSVDTVSLTLQSAIDGYIRVSCRSSRFEPNDDSHIYFSGLSGNAVMTEDWQNFVVGGGDE